MRPGHASVDQAGTELQARVARAVLQAETGSALSQEVYNALFLVEHSVKSTAASSRSLTIGLPFTPDTFQLWALASLYSLQSP